MNTSTRVALLAVAACAVAFAAACGGDPEDAVDAASTPAGATVASSDGSARLLLPSQLPDGVAPSDIVVEVRDEAMPAPPPDRDPEAELPSRTLLVQLGPDGLEFDEPARLEVTVPVETLGDTALAFHVHRGEIELLDLEAVIEGEDATLSMEVRSFSDVLIEFYQFQASAEYHVRVEALPSRQEALVGAEFDVNATMDRPNFERKVTGHLDLDGTHVWAEYLIRFTGADWTVGQGRFDADAGILSPESIDEAPKGPVRVTAVAYATDFVYFTCIAPGEARIDYHANIHRNAEAIPQGPAAELGFPGREVNLYLLYKTWDHSGRQPSPRAAYVDCVTELSPTPTPRPSTSVPDGHVRSEALVIGGEHYPIEQFRSAGADRCDAQHWHADGPVYSIEGMKQTPPASIQDAHPDECGFGRLSEVPRATVDVPDAEWQRYRETLVQGTR